MGFSCRCSYARVGQMAYNRLRGFIELWACHITSECEESLRRQAVFRRRLQAARPTSGAAIVITQWRMRNRSQASE